MILSEIRQEARQRLQGLWTSLIPVWFIYLTICFGVSFVFGKDTRFMGSITLWILGGPLAMGLTRIFLKIYNHEPFEFGQMFDGFKEFGRTLSAYLLILLFTFLWLLLLIVPGIIAALGYSMTFFIMAEDPDITASDAMRKSKELMMGHKAELFWLGFSFIGWVLLSFCTLGIGFLWLESYIFASVTIFYKKIKGETEAVPVVEPEPVKIFREEETI
jgi:uncharacterized membrane protein